MWINNHLIVLPGMIGLIIQLLLSYVLVYFFDTQGIGGTWFHAKPKTDFGLFHLSLLLPF